MGQPIIQCPRCNAGSERCREEYTEWVAALLSGQYGTVWTARSRGVIVNLKRL